MKATRHQYVGIREARLAVRKNVGLLNDCIEIELVVLRGELDPELRLVVE